MLWVMMKIDFQDKESHTENVLNVISVFVMMNFIVEIAVKEYILKMVLMMTDKQIIFSLIESKESSLCLVTSKPRESLKNLVEMLDKMKIKRYRKLLYRPNYLFE